MRRVKREAEVGAPASEPAAAASVSLDENFLLIGEEMLTREPFTLHDQVEYRWSTHGPFVGEAEIVELLGDGRYRLERLDGISLPREGSIFAEGQLRLKQTANS
jgi:hypothetical protein